VDCFMSSNNFYPERFPPLVRIGIFLPVLRTPRESYPSRGSKAKPGFPSNTFPKGESQSFFPTSSQPHLLFITRLISAAVCDGHTTKHCNKQCLKSAAPVVLTSGCIQHLGERNFPKLPGGCRRPVGRTSYKPGLSKVPS